MLCLESWLRFPLHILRCPFTAGEERICISHNCEPQKGERTIATKVLFHVRKCVGIQTAWHQAGEHFTSDEPQRAQAVSKGPHFRNSSVNPFQRFELARISAEQDVAMTATKCHHVQLTRSELHVLRYFAVYHPRDGSTKMAAMEE